MAERHPPSKKPQRRSPISRQEGERRLIAAATSLLQSQPFSTVSVRQLSAVADVHQSYIHTWFGSQHGLFLRVLEEILAEFLGSISDQPADVIPIDPNSAIAQFATRLLLWLDLEGCDLSTIAPTFDALVAATGQRLSTAIGLEPETAAKVSPYVATFFFGMSAFGRQFGTDPAQLHKAGTAWLRQVDSLSHELSANQERQQ